MVSSNVKPAARNKKNYKRSIKYIKKRFQRNFIIKFCIIACLALIVASTLVYILSSGTMTATYRYHSLSLEPTSEAIVPALAASSAAVLVFFILATVYVTLYISHKIAGPLFRLEQDLQIMAKGDLSKRVRLRDDDQLTELAEQLNHLIESLEGKVTVVRTHISELQEFIADPACDIESIKGQVDHLITEMDRSFKTSG